MVVVTVDVGIVVVSAIVVTDVAAEDNELSIEHDK